MKKIIYFILGIIIVLIVATVIGYSFNNKRQEQQNNTDNTEETEKKEEGSIDKPIQKDRVDSTEYATTYKYKHYEYEIPNDIEYNPKELTFNLSSEDKWNAIVALMYDKDGVMTNDSNYIKGQLETNGYSVEKVDTTSINNREYILITCNKGSVKHSIAYIDIDESYGYEIDLTGDDEYIQEGFELIDKIIHNAKHDGEETEYYYYSIK